MRNLLCLAASVLSVCLFVPPTAAQPVLNQDGSITITTPTLAPPLPAAVADQAADQSIGDADVSADRMTLRERRKLGFTRLAAIRAATKLARAGQLPSTKGLSGEDLAAAKAEITETIALEMVGENVQIWKTTVGERDWSVFFQALLDFLEQFLPILLQIIDRFGGLTDNAIVTPATGVADLVPVVAPPVMLAA